MKKLLGKKNLKIIAATAMTIFSLFAAMTGVFAWFTSKMNEAANGDEFAIYHDDSQITTLSCYAIKYDGVTGARAKQFVTGGNHDIAMSEYDYILRDRNINTPLFLRIELAGFDKDKDLQIKIPSTGSFLAPNQTYIDNKLSNVVCAKFLYGLKKTEDGELEVDDNVLSGDNITTAAVKEIYEGMKLNAKGYTGTPFVQSSSQKDREITLELSHTLVYDEDFLVDRTVDGKAVKAAVIYIAFDYYVTSTVNLVEEYIQSYEGTGVQHSLSFTPDIGAISLRDK